MSIEAPHEVRVDGDAPRTPRGRDVEPLAHVLLALAVSTASLILAYWTLWPGGADPGGPRGIVLAAEAIAMGAEAGADGVQRSLPRADRRVAAGSRTEDEPLALEEAAEGLLRGAVVDEWSRPVPTAEVWVDDGGWRLATRCDAAGEFELAYDVQLWEQRLASGEGLRVGARDAGHGPALVTPLTRLDDAPLRLVLRGDGAALRLELTDTRGRPVAGARVSLAPPAEDGRERRVLTAEGELREPTPLQPGVTDAWGELLLEGLEPGVRELTLECPGYSTRTGPVALVEGRLVRRRIQLSATARVEGRARRSDGEDPAGVRITARAGDAIEEFTARCDGSGRFALEGLPAGELRLVAQTDGDDTPLRASAELGLAPGETATWLPLLQPVEPVRGRLTDADGAPLAGWRVELREGHAQPGPEQARRTDEDGRYEVLPPPFPNDARLLFFHPLAQHGVPSRVLPRLDDRREGVDVELEEGEESVSQVYGRVLRPDGSGASAQPLLIQRISDRYSVVVPLGADGRFTSPALPPGEYIAVLPRHGRGWTQDRAWHLDGRGPFDAGAIQLPATGTLTLLTSLADRQSETYLLRLDLLRDGVAAGFSLPVFVGALEAPMLLTLAPGAYRLSFPGRPEQPPLPFEIESGQTTPLVLPARE